MKALQGTWPGALLDSERMQVTGWTEGSFTASSDAHSNLPLGFNHRANEFLLQQNWVRFERTAVAGCSLISMTSGAWTMCTRWPMSDE